MSNVHNIVAEGLEQFLEGNPPAGFQEHLAVCQDCRNEVDAFQQVSVLLGDLAAVPDLAPEPPPGFYLRVASEIAESRRVRFWNLFSPSPAFFHRVAMASVLLLAGLGAFMVTREASADHTDAVALMAEFNAPPSANTSVQEPLPASPAPVDNASSRDRLLSTLVSYGE